MKARRRQCCFTHPEQRRALQEESLFHTQSSENRCTLFNPGSYLLFCLFPDLHLQILQPADRAGSRRLGLDFGRQCASLHRPRVNLRTHQLTAGDLSPDFLLFWGWFRFFLFLRVSCISFSGSSLNGGKNNPYASVRPTQGECLLIFFNDNDGKNREMYD